MRVIAITGIVLIIHMVALLIAVNIRSWLITFLVAKIKTDVDGETYSAILNHYQNFFGRFVNFSHHAILKTERDRKVMTLSNRLVNYFNLSILVLTLLLVVLSFYSSLL